MAPPTEPRRGETAVSFVDTPGLVRVSGTVEMVDLAYWKFLTLINKLSATVCHKLDRLPRQYAEGRGFVIGDGPWWYRFVKDSVDGNKNEEVGPWTILDNVHAYENMVAQVTLGLKWADARIDVQHVRPSTLVEPLELIIPVQQKVSANTLASCRTYRRKETRLR